jgi:hypothetical protein
MIQAPFSLSPEHYATLGALTTYAPQSGARLRLARQQELQAGSLRYLWGASTRAFFRFSFRAPKVFGVEESLDAPDFSEAVRAW